MIQASLKNMVVQKLPMCLKLTSSQLSESCESVETANTVYKLWMNACPRKGEFPNILKEWALVWAWAPDRYFTVYT